MPSDKLKRKGSVMRVNFGSRRSRRNAPMNPMPKYYQYHVGNPGADVTIAAWQCPVQAPPSAPPEWFERNCRLPIDNVDFTISATDGAEVAHNGKAIAAPLPTLPELRIAAIPTPGYAPEPYLKCEIASPNGGEDNESGASIRCNWYTWQIPPADITVYAWECPEGYDLTSPTADLMSDCTGIASGVQFRLRNVDPNRELVADSGAYRTGAARFGDLQPGEYVLSELNAADGDTDTIVWRCFGVHAERAQPTPGEGPEMTFTLTGGEHILCHRFRIRGARRA